MRRLIIVGAGGHGRVVADAAESRDEWDEICFVDGRYPMLQLSGAWHVIGSDSSSAVLAAESAEFVVAIGRAATRTRLLRELTAAGAKVVSVIHPAATVSRYATLGLGTVVMAGACVSVGATLGVGVIVNTGATVDHDCRLADGVHICPGAHLAGDVVIGEDSWVGIGASVKQGVVIGSGVMIGAGAAVVTNLPTGCSALGVPARVRE